MPEFDKLMESQLAPDTPQQGAIITGKIVYIGEKGIFVDIGTKSEGVLPLDQVLPHELPRLQVGDEVKVKIMRRVDGEYHLSKTAADFEEVWNLVENAHKNEKIIEIEITRKTKNGFLARCFGLLEGFAHDSNFASEPKVGEIYKAQILQFDRKSGKLVFTRRTILKQEEEMRRLEEFERFRPGMVVDGTVESLAQYGAFVKLSDRVTGLVHLSELAWHQVKRPSEVVRKGQKVKVKILQVDSETRKIALSLKALQPDPLSLLFPGEEVEGKVQSVTDFGVFVELPNKATGLAHISELSHRKVSHPSELFKPKQKVKAKVLKVDLENRRLALSIKACEEDPWDSVQEKYPEGANVQGKIIELLENGMVVRLDDFFEGFVPISEIALERIDHPKRKHKVDETLTFKVVHVDKKRRRIRLSRKQVLLEASQSVKEKQVEPVEVPPTEMPPLKVTLGDIIDTSKIKVEEEK